MREDHDGTADLDEAFGPPGSRYAAVSRRAFLARSAQATGIGAAAVVLAACGHNDAEVFARGPAASAAPASSTPGTTSRATTAPPTSGATTSPQQPTTSRPASTQPTSTQPASTQPSTTAAPSTVSGDMGVRFTYKPAASGGRVNNPYVAVWVEDSSGALVDTLGIWYQQNSKGVRYLNELRRWASVDGSSETLDTVSSPTRAPGDYALVWKLTDAEGQRVAPGSYFICIEAAREHGPYSLIRQPFTLGSETFKTDLPAQGELSNASIAHPAG